MTWTRIIACAVVAATMATAAFAQATDPAAAMKAINDYRTKAIADARTAGKTVDINALSAETLKMAKDAVKGVDPNKVDPAQGYNWANLFRMAGETKSACTAAERFLTTNPDANAKYQAQNLMLSCCNELGEAMMVMELIQAIQPPNDNATLSLVSMTANLYADTIREKAGLNAALATLRLMEAKLNDVNPADDAGKARVRSTIAGLGSAKAEMLNEAGRKSDALATIEATITKLGGATAPEARSLNGLKTRMTLVGSIAPALQFERTIGEFAGLESLKGKVVIVDFFAHWCGPCIRSFPDMKQLYSDFKGKGLEIVGFTTYYGYYKQENTQKRDMPKDVEFAKMGEFVKEYQLPWPVVYGERTNFDAYGVTGIPHVAVIDRKGNVHKIKVGYSPELFKEFRAAIEKLINE